MYSVDGLIMIHLKIIDVDCRFGIAVNRKYNENREEDLRTG